MPVDGLTGLGLQLSVELHGVLEHARRVARRSQLADQTGRVPRRPVGEPMLLEQHHIRLAHRREVVGDAAADDSTADDHDPGLRGHPALGHGLGHGRRLPTVPIP